MPRASVRLSESALTDLEQIREWFTAQQAPEVGERFLTEILLHIDRLRDHPDMGRVVPEFDQPTLRELIHPPFRIVYRNEKRRIEIVRAWRSERLLRMPDKFD
jgi:toxin ParE1/3/4